MTGKCSLTLEHKNELFDVSFVVVDTKSIPNLGLESRENLKLIKRICSVESKENLFLFEFSDCFGEIGTLNKTHHIEIKGNFTPVVTPARRIPHSLKPKVEKELKRMVDLDIIEPVDESTDWVNGLVIVEKPNEKLRICLNPRSLNQAIKREHLHLPTAEKLFSQMSGAKCFSKLDASSGYWQIKVDRESSNLLTFGTTIGRFRFKRLPYGIHSASEVFQKTFLSIISDIQGSANSQDDIVISGKILAEHDNRLRKVLLKVRESGLKLDMNKCQFRLYF